MLQSDCFSAEYFVFVSVKIFDTKNPPLQPDTVRKQTVHYKGFKPGSKKPNEFCGNPFSLLYHQVTRQQFTFKKVLCNRLVLTQVQTQGDSRKEGRQRVEWWRPTVFTVPWSTPEWEFKTQSRHRDFSPPRPTFWVCGCCWWSCMTRGKLPPKHAWTVQWPQETMKPVLFSSCLSYSTRATTEPKLNSICPMKYLRCDHTEETLTMSVKREGR